MDPATAIGVASGVIAFIDFSWKLVTGAKNLYDKGETQTAENVRIGKIIKDLKEFSLDLDGGSLGTSKHEKALRTLATNCGDLCQELIDILEKLKAKRNSRWETLKTTWASMRRADDINDIERRLGEYRAEMNTRILALINEQQSTLKVQLDNIQSQAQRLSSSSADELKKLRADFITLLRKLEEEYDDESEVDSVSSVATGAHQELFDSLKEVSCKLSRLEGLMKTTSREIRILEHLYFEGIFNRVDAIEKAAKDTFQWILQSDSDFRAYLEAAPNPNPYCSAPGYQILHTGPESDDSAPTRFRPSPQADGSEFPLSPEHRQCMSDGRRRFQDWLSGDHGIFHISGKAGCGKSTLLKLIIGHEKTAQALETWAGKNKLIISSFFFWRSDGDKHQMTLTGMRRSILFSTLRQCPRLIPQVLPQQWKHVSANPSSKILESEMFRASKIDEAFDLLMRLSTESEEMGISWCLFIDGLDEYDASDYDQRSFAMSLRDWSRTSSVKICVTSRPEVHFLDTFSSQTRIHLHELTDADIYHSARLMFEKDEVFPRVSKFYLNLVQRIVNLAEGVFLWARLVVKLLITEAGLHSSYTTLLAKLRNTPLQLDDLYDSLFSAMSQDDKRKAYFLLLITATNPFRQNINSTVFDYVDVKGNLKIGHHLPEHTCHNVFQAQERLSRQIQNLTRGLLALASPAEDSPFSNLGIKEIRFYHRTVKDYVLTPTRTAEFQLMFPRYDRRVTHAAFRMMEIGRTPLWLCDVEHLTQQFLETLWPSSLVSLATMRMLEVVWKEKFKSLRGVYWLSCGHDGGQLYPEQSSELLPLKNSFPIVAVYYGHIQYLQKHLGNSQHGAAGTSHGTDPKPQSCGANSPVAEVEQHGIQLLLGAILSLDNKHANIGNSASMIEMLISVGHTMKQQTAIRGGDAASTNISRRISLWVVFAYIVARNILRGLRYAAVTKTRIYVAALKRIILAERPETTFILLQDCGRKYGESLGGTSHPGTPAPIYISTISDLATVGCSSFQSQASDFDSPTMLASKCESGSRSIPSWLKKEVEFFSEPAFMTTHWLKSVLDNKSLFQKKSLRVLAVVTRKEAIFRPRSGGIDPALQLW